MGGDRFRLVGFFCLSSAGHFPLVLYSPEKRIGCLALLSVDFLGALRCSVLGITVAMRETRGCCGLLLVRSLRYEARLAFFFTTFLLTFFFVELFAVPFFFVALRFRDPVVNS